MGRAFFSPRPWNRPIPGRSTPAGKEQPPGTPVLRQPGVGCAFGAPRGWQAVDTLDACVLRGFHQQFCDCHCHGLLQIFGVFESNRRLREGIPVSLIAHSFVSVLPGLEDLIEIDAFGRRAAKCRELLGRNFEVAIDASFAAIDDGEGTGFVVVGHGGDDAGGHQGINSRKLEMQ
jgi:hypothetical protein